MKFKDLAPELQELVIQRMTEQQKLDRLGSKDTSIATLFTWGAPETVMFWDGVNKGRDMTNDPCYPHHLKTYSIY